MKEDLMKSLGLFFTMFVCFWLIFHVINITQNYEAFKFEYKISLAEFKSIKTKKLDAYKIDRTISFYASILIALVLSQCTLNRVQSIKKDKK